MFCSYCGKKIADDSLFCSQCGKMQNLITDQQENMNDTDPDTTPILEPSVSPQKEEASLCSAEEPVSEQEEQDQWYVEPIPTETGKISCPICNHIQLASRKRCFKCGTYFDKTLEEKLKNRIVLPSAKNTNSNKNSQPVFCCPNCGHKDLQVINETSSQTSGGGYSAGKGCLGYLLLGPLGLLCGSCGQSQTTTTTNRTYWVCPKCGKKFRSPDELRQKIASLQSSVLGIMCAIGGVLALILFCLFAEADIQIALFLGLFAFGIFALMGFLAQKANESASEKLETELRELEANMRKFSNE